MKINYALPDWDAARRGLVNIALSASGVATLDTTISRITAVK